MPIKTILICDKCGAILELTGPYHFAKQEMKEQGWKNRNAGTRDKPKWEIVCPECLKKEGGR